MSTVKTNNAQIGQSATATNNFTWYQPASPDGTVRLGVGNSGATSADVMTLNSSGNVGIGTSSLTAGYRLTVAGGNVYLNNANGWITGNTSLNFYGDLSSSSGMRLDSSGNLGLGVTPSAWKSGYKALDIPAGSFGGNTAVADVIFNAYDNGSNWVYKTSAAASNYRQAGSHTWYSAPSGTAAATFSFTQVLAVDKDQTLALQGASSQSGTGITFPATQSASSNANTLDDYEEGTFTPELSVSGYTFSFASQAGLYTKIGNAVFFKLYFTATYVSGSGTLLGSINGLPFTSSGNAANYGGASWSPDSGSQLFSRVGSIRTGVSTTNLTIVNGWIGSGVGGVNWAAMPAGMEFEVSGHYFV